MTKKKKKPVRALTSRAKNRSSKTPRMAASTGDRKRTPSTVSQQIAVRSGVEHESPQIILFRDGHARHCQICRKQSHRRLSHDNLVTVSNLRNAHARHTIPLHSRSQRPTRLNSLFLSATGAYCAEARKNKEAAQNAALGHQFLLPRRMRVRVKVETSIKIFQF